MIDTAHVQRWLDAYVDAWSTYDPAAIGRWRERRRRGVTRYYTGAGREALEKEFHNLWVLSFAGNGQCSSFTEWYLRSPSRRGQA